MTPFGAADRSAGDALQRSSSPAAAPSDAPLARHACPLCGGPNDCAPAQSGSFATRCWCESASFDAALLARAAGAEGGAACICPRCAGVSAACGTLAVSQRAPVRDDVE